MSDWASAWMVSSREKTLDISVDSGRNYGPTKRMKKSTKDW